MHLRKFPKRNILIHPAEYADFRRLLLNSFEDGDSVRDFENEFSRFTGTDNAVAVSSGRFALSLILKHLGMNKGDGILLSAYNYPGVPALLLKEGFAVQFVDADAHTYQMDIRALESSIKNNTRAVIVTHLFGHPAELNAVFEICRRRRLFVIEDAAHALGSYYRGKHTGTAADAGLFSFSGSKILNTSFGGMIVTQDRGLAERIRKDLSEVYAVPSRGCLIMQRAATYIYALLTHKLFYSAFGYPVSLAAGMCNLDPFELYHAGNCREIAEEKMLMSGFQAKIGLGYLRDMRAVIARRSRDAEYLISRLSPDIPLQRLPDGCSPNYFMIAFRSRDKMKAYKKLLVKGIDTSLGYAYDCSSISGGPGNRAAEMLGRSILTLHLPFSLSEQDICRLSESLNELKDLLR